MHSKRRTLTSILFCSLQPHLELLPACLADRLPDLPRTCPPLHTFFFTSPLGISRRSCPYFPEDYSLCFHLGLPSNHRNLVILLTQLPEQARAHSDLLDAHLYLHLREARCTWSHNLPAQPPIVRRLTQRTTVRIDQRRAHLD